MRPSPVVAAIVPTFNRKALLAQCLESLLAQTRPPDRILVVDDGSEDGTDEMVATRFGDRVEYLHKPNGGKSSALNLGLAHCGDQVDFVWICDDDDLAEAGACEALAGTLHAHPEADFAYGRYRLLYEEPGGRRRLVEPYGWPGPGQDDLFLAMMERMFILQFSSMVRRSALEALGPFRVELIRSQDYEMLLRLVHRGRGVLVDQVVFLQRQHTGPRGARSDSFAAEASYERWRTYDRIFFTEWRERLGTEGFTPPFARAWSGEARTRAALVQRAVIFGRRGLWDLAAEDLREVARLGDGLTPSREERTLVKRMAAEVDALRVLGRDRALVRELGAARAYPYGRALLAGLVRPLFWLVRRDMAAGRLRCSFSAASLLRRLCFGPARAATRA